MSSTEGHINQCFCAVFLFLAFNDLPSLVLLGTKKTNFCCKCVSLTYISMYLSLHIWNVMFLLNCRCRSTLKTMSFILARVALLMDLLYKESMEKFNWLQDLYLLHMTNKSCGLPRFQNVFTSGEPLLFCIHNVYLTLFFSLVRIEGGNCSR